MKELSKFLTLPFSKSELEKNLAENPNDDFQDSLYHITEWYIYHPGLHWYAFHWWVDRHLPYWSTVYAPCDWYIMSSYNFQRAVDEEWNYRMIWDSRISYWLWFCTQIYNPESQLFVIIWHLSYLASWIPFTPPKRTTSEKWYDMWSCSGFQFNHELVDQIDNVPRCKKIQRWDYIWDVGLSWLKVTNEFPEEIEQPRKRLSFEDLHYTKPHIHMNVLSRNYLWKKKTPFDSYDVYSSSEEYPTHFSSWMRMWENHLFIVWDNGLPLYADEYYNHPM